MKHYTCPRDLKQFGFDCLTGEACGLSMRLLFDVTAGAHGVLIKAMGLQDVTLNPAWNGGESVGCIMLTHEFCQTLAVFAMLESGCLEVWQHWKNKNIVGIETRKELDELLFLSEHLPSYDEDGWRRFRYGGTAGDRNRHVMSGRVA